MLSSDVLTSEFYLLYRAVFLIHLTRIDVGNEYKVNYWTKTTFFYQSRKKDDIKYFKGKSSQISDLNWDPSTVKWRDEEKSHV